MKELNIAIVIWVNQKKEIYLQFRSETGPLDGFLEFPGGKIEANETPIQAAKREFLEETSFNLSEGATFNRFKTYHYSYPDRKVTLHTFTLDDLKSEKQCSSWYPMIFTDKILKANKDIIDDLKTRYIKNN